MRAWYRVALAAALLVVAAPGYPSNAEPRAKRKTARAPEKCHTQSMNRKPSDPYSIMKTTCGRKSPNPAHVNLHRSTIVIRDWDDNLLFEAKNLKGDVLVFGCTKEFEMCGFLQRVVDDRGYFSEGRLRVLDREGRVVYKYNSDGGLMGGGWGMSFIGLKTAVKSRQKNPPEGRDKDTVIKISYLGKKPDQMIRVVGLEALGCTISAGRMLWCKYKPEPLGPRHDYRAKLDDLPEYLEVTPDQFKPERR